MALGREPFLSFDGVFTAIPSSCARKDSLLHAPPVIPAIERETPNLFSLLHLRLLHLDPS
jgi:hypothetical protein